MKPPGKTTLNRMMASAIEEQDRIEIGQGGRIDPWPHLVRKRDDFAGVVRLLTIIEADEALRGRIGDLMAAAYHKEEAARDATPAPAKAVVAAKDAPAAAAAVDPSEIIYDTDTEVEA
jgi:hypothetical protein